MAPLPLEVFHQFWVYRAGLHVRRVSLLTDCRIDQFNHSTKEVLIRPLNPAWHSRSLYCAASPTTIRRSTSTLLRLTACLSDISGSRARFSVAEQAVFAAVWLSYSARAGDAARSDAVSGGFQSG